MNCSAAVQGALASGGVIILITAAGGAFGAAVRQSGVSEEIANLTGNTTSLWILPVAFMVTTLVRSAQGSATVAMITAVSLFDYLAAPGPPRFSPCLPCVSNRLRVETDRLDGRQRFLGHLQNERHDRRRSIENGNANEHHHGSHRFDRDTGRSLAVSDEHLARRQFLLAC